MKLDGRVVDVSEIPDILAGLQFSASFHPKFAVLHNTDTPDIALYEKWVAAGKPTPEQWGRNLASYYAGLGWNSMPHGFVLPDGRILLGAPFNVQGTHTPSWNRFSIGIEMVGNFDRETFAGTPTEKTAVALFGELNKFFEWEPDHYVRGVQGIHFHKEDIATTHKNCPGKNAVKPKFVSDVVAYMGLKPSDDHSHVDVPVNVQTADTPTLTTDQMTSTTWLQERLNAHGATITVDGLIGPATRNAVRVFQRAKGLDVDGIAGPLTRLALAS